MNRPAPKSISKLNARNIISATFGSPPKTKRNFYSAKDQTAYSMRGLLKD